MPELRDMRQKADSQKREHAMAEASMSKLEEEARKQYEQDMKAAQDAHEGTYGSWVGHRHTTVLNVQYGSVPSFLCSSQSIAVT